MSTNIRNESPCRAERELVLTWRWRHLQYARRLRGIQIRRDRRVAGYSISGLANTVVQRLAGADAVGLARTLSQVEDGSSALPRALGAAIGQVLSVPADCYDISAFGFYGEDRARTIGEVLVWHSQCPLSPGGEVTGVKFPVGLQVAQEAVPQILVADVEFAEGRDLPCGLRADLQDTLVTILAAGPEHGSVLSVEEVQLDGIGEGDGRVEVVWAEDSAGTGKVDVGRHRGVPSTGRADDATSATSADVSTTPSSTRGTWATDPAQAEVLGGDR